LKTLRCRDEATGGSVLPHGALAGRKRIDPPGALRLRAGRSMHKGRQAGYSQPVAAGSPAWGACGRTSISAPRRCWSSCRPCSCAWSGRRS
jgi:hypothetical protein